MSCGTDSLTGSAAAVVNKLATASKIAVARGPGAVSEISLSAIGDFEFTSERGSDSAAAAAIATRVNNVDGYFSEQVGVQISLAQPVETHSDPDDPFTDESEAGLLLDQVSEYRLQNSVHSNQGLTHLWTGRDLDTSTVGVAWEGVLCDTYFGAGLSEGNDGPFFDSLIAAHEIGHNFGAQHDGEPSSLCPDEVGSFIMSASVNGSEEFSDCSIAIMQAEAAGAACVTALPTVDVSIMPTAVTDELLFGVSADLDYQVSSNGTLAAAGVLASFTYPGNLTLDSASTSVGSCSSGAGVIDCDLGDIAGISSETITLSVTPAAIGVGTITAAASTTDADERPSNNQHAAQLSVIAAVDLAASAPTAPNVNIDANTTVTTNIQNLSTFDATNVTASIVLQTGLQAVSANWPVGTCTVTAQQIDCQASTLAASTISTLTITVTGVTKGRRDVTLTIASTEPDTTPANNVVSGEVVVRDPDDEKDDSGGAINPFMLLLGLCALLGARRRQLTQR
jgi:MYXO-CTERM domain-containing protein